MGCWNSGVLEHWGRNTALHYSTTPVLQRLLRWSEAIERNEAGESFSAVCQEES